MQPNLKFALLIGAVLLTAGAAIAQSNSQPAPADDSYEKARSGRFLAQFDLNHDGRVTHDEFNRTEGAHFAGAAHGPTMTIQQFTADSLKRRTDREREYFRRADWSGDGKLSLDEYQAPLRSKFTYADRKSSGTVSCAPRNTNTGNANDTRRRGPSSRGLCFGNDLNQDGKVTRGEFDAATAKAFAAAAHGQKLMTFDQYAAVGAAKYQETSQRIFQRMDGNGDGKLTLAEYALPQQKQFARYDRNGDGIVTRDEIAAAAQQKSGQRPVRFSSR